jgi:organic radical activating enzyme
MKKIIFGAGKWGRYAIKKYGKENIQCIIDNNPEKAGKSLDGIQIFDAKELVRICREDKYEIIIAVKNGKSIEKQLKELNITNYSYYHSTDAFFPTSELVVNPYEMLDGLLNSSQSNIDILIQEEAEKVEQLKNTDAVFDNIEIETVNRCNGGCSFCPVNTKNDPREYQKMTEKLFYKIIGELEDMDYQGKIALYSNNEPFLDDRIIDFQKYARAHLPKARFHLFTNGTLLTLDKFVEIIPYLDELVIDNYNQNLELIPNNKKIVDYCEEHEELKNKVTVVLRKIDEVLTTRGGDAPNARTVSYPDAKCVLPFRQMIVRPDGKVSLCCNDPLGRNTLADLNEETLLEAWNNPRFRMVRKCLDEGGRKNWKHCEYCDTFYLG